jgi:hypothetical protein
MTSAPEMPMPEAIVPVAVTVSVTRRFVRSPSTSTQPSAAGRRPVERNVVDR